VKITALPKKKKKEKKIDFAIYSKTHHQFITRVIVLNIPILFTSQQNISYTFAQCHQVPDSTSNHQGTCGT
jgi:hypothetical protein